MKRLVAASLFALMPMPALSDTDCASLWVEVRSLAASFGAADRIGQITSAEDGWCNFATADATLSQRASVAGRFQIAELDNTRSVELEFSGQDTPLGPLEGRMEISQDTLTGAVQVHVFDVQGADGRGLRMNGQLHGAAFEDAAQAQEALADVAFTALSFDFIVTPDALGDLRIDFSDVTRASVDMALREVTAPQVSGQTKREFLRFVGAAPNAQGTLRATVEAAERRTVLSLVAPFFALGNAPSDDAIARAFEAALDSATLTVTWNPGRM
ncbi:hypothetical protein [Yoonia algicola]|uniref:DUF2125 domain-containing protein n=1 Tax=Yoonia algicola TaxID=3137368 RepID=A0AAN0NGR8_9RHOB